MDHSTACRVLGLEEATRLDKCDVEQAFRKAALESHPDRGGTNERFQQITEAKEHLLHFLDTEQKKPSTVAHASKYDEPSTQSPLSPLRQMGEPVNLSSLGGEEVARLWTLHQLQCLSRLLF